MKLKGFSTLWVKIKQFLFMKRLSYIKYFYTSTKYDRFCNRDKFNHSLKLNNSKMDKNHL